MGGSENCEANPIWWSLTVGSQTFAVKATSSRIARNIVAESLGTTHDEMITVPTITTPHNQESQDALEYKFQELELIRVIPLSLEPWPVGAVTLSEAQRLAAQNLR